MTPEFTVPCPKCGQLQDDEMRAERSHKNKKLVDGVKEAVFDAKDA